MEHEWPHSDSTPDKMHTKTVAAATVEVMYRMVSLYPHPLLVTKFLILYLCKTYVKTSAMIG